MASLPAANTSNSTGHGQRPAGRLPKNRRRADGQALPGGSQVENLAVCCLLKYAHFRKDAYGENWDLFYLRDKENRDVDFVVTLNRKVQWLIEAKASDDEIGGSLRYYSERLQPKQPLHLALNLHRPQERSGIKVLPLAAWLESLRFSG